MIIDLTHSVLFEEHQNDSTEEMGKWLTQEESLKAHKIWKEWTLENYGKMKYPPLDHATEMISAALLDDRMRNILKVCASPSIRSEIAHIIDVYEKHMDDIDVEGATQRNAALGIAALDRHEYERTK